jgi:hypothetical protein
MILGHTYDDYLVLLAKSGMTNELFDFPPHCYSRAFPLTSSHALSHFSHGPKHHSYGFGS